MDTSRDEEMLCGVKIARRIGLCSMPERERPSLSSLKDSPLYYLETSLTAMIQCLEDRTWYVLSFKVLSVWVMSRIECKTYLIPLTGVPDLQNDWRDLMSIFVV